ncbi:MAG: DnaB-like helicase C-terminal domain-containing protein [Atribacterota bacterium]
MDSDFIEKLILKTLFQDKNFLLMVSNVFMPEFFNDKMIGEVFKHVKEHTEKYVSIPDRSIVRSMIEKKNEFDSLMNNIDSIDFDLAENYKYLLDKTNEYLKEQALKQAILKSVDIVNNKDNVAVIEEIVKHALSKDLMINLGLDYFKNLADRLKRMFNADKNRIPTYYPQLDEYLNGGFPSFTLNFLIGQIHGWKSAAIANIASRQVINGKNVVIATMEMCEDMYASRMDAIFSCLDINRMYLPNNRKKLVESLKELKDSKERGTLFIKQFPTGEATRNDIRAYLRELTIRNINIDILYVDYINIMKSSLQKGLYENVKSLAEELRSLSFEFNAPIFSVSQLNREGGMISLSDTSLYHISECLDKNTIVYKKDVGETKIGDINVGDQIKGSSSYVTVLRKGLKKKKKYKIKTKSGKEIICSADHKFPSDKGILSINNGLKVGDKLNTK